MTSRTVGTTKIVREIAVYVAGDRPVTVPVRLIRDSAGMDVRAVIMNTAEVKRRIRRQRFIAFFRRLLKKGLALIG